MRKTPGEHGPSKRQPRSRKPAGKDAFGEFLRRGLHELYGSVANEPIPQDLLDLIGRDREAARKPKKD